MRSIIGGLAVLAGLGLSGCVAVPLIGGLAAIGSIAGTAAGVAGAASAAGTAAAGSATSGAGTAAASGAPAASAADASAAQASGGPGVEQSAGPGHASQSAPGFQQSAGPGYASQSGPGFQQSAGPGYASQSGPGFQQSAGPGYASQSGPGFQQSAGPGYASQSGPGFQQSAGPGYASQSTPFGRQAVVLAPPPELVVAGLVVGAFVHHTVLAINLSRRGRATAQSMGLAVSDLRLRHLGIRVARMKLPRGARATEVLDRLRRADPDGTYDLDTVYRLAGQAAPCMGTRCYGEVLVGLPTQGCPLRARIGMVDSAIDAKHPALAGRRLSMRRFHSTAPTAAESEHGTAVAGMLVGAPTSDFPGLLPEAELIAADIFQSDDRGTPYTDAAAFVEALNWVAGQRPSVVNLSIAGPDSDILDSAIEHLQRRGIGVVAAAGNLGPQGAVQYPAGYPGVLAVTAVDRRLTIYPQASQGNHVGLSAPGVGVWTPAAGGAGQFRDGTSFAAPFVTAAYAILRASERRLNPPAVLARLRQSARDIGAPGVDAVFGAGLVQALSCPSA
ncbi:MAG: S8 family serine peptidase [Sinimarinibacterium sp.]